MAHSPSVTWPIRQQLWSDDSCLVLYPALKPCDVTLNHVVMTGLSKALLFSVICVIYRWAVCHCMTLHFGLLLQQLPKCVPVHSSLSCPQKSKNLFWKKALLPGNPAPPQPVCDAPVLFLSVWFTSDFYVEGMDYPEVKKVFGSFFTCKTNEDVWQNAKATDLNHMNQKCDLYDCWKN